MDEEHPEELKSVYFVGFWMPLERTIDRYVVIHRVKEQLNSAMGKLLADSDPIWHQNASMTICSVDPSTGFRKWVDSSIILTTLFNTWLQCSSIAKPNLDKEQIGTPSKDGKISPSSTDNQPHDGPSWSNQSLRACPLLHVMTVGFSGFEIDRMKLSKVIEIFGQTVMSLMSSTMKFRKDELLARKAQKNHQEYNKLRVLVPLSSWVEKIPSKPSLLLPISFRTPSPFEQVHGLAETSLEPTNSFFETVLTNHLFVDRLLNYVENFIKSAKIKWQCVLEFSLYVIEVALNLTRWIAKPFSNVVCHHQKYTT